VSKTRLGEEGLKDPGKEERLGEVIGFPKVGGWDAVGVSGGAWPLVVILDWLAFEKAPIIVLDVVRGAVGVGRADRIIFRKSS